MPFSTVLWQRQCVLVSETSSSRGGCFGSLLRQESLEMQSMTPPVPASTSWQSRLQKNLFRLNSYKQLSLLGVDWKSGTNTYSNSIFTENAWFRQQIESSGFEEKKHICPEHHSSNDEFFCVHQVKIFQVMISHQIRHAMIAASSLPQRLTVRLVPII